MSASRINTPRHVQLVIDPGDASACGEPCQWALGELERAFCDRRVSVSRSANVAAAADGSLRIFVTGKAGAVPHPSVPTAPESLALLRVDEDDGASIYVYGADRRGLVYAITELADCVAQAPDDGRDALDLLDLERPLVE